MSKYASKKCVSMYVSRLLVCGLKSLHCQQMVAVAVAGEGQFSMPPAVCVACKQQVSEYVCHVCLYACILCAYAIAAVRPRPLHGLGDGVERQHCLL